MNGNDRDDEVAYVAEEDREAEESAVPTECGDCRSCLNLEDGNCHDIKARNHKTEELCNAHDSHLWCQSHDSENEDLGESQQTSTKNRNSHGHSHGPSGHRRRKEESGGYGGEHAQDGYLNVVTGIMGIVSGHHEHGHHEHGHHEELVHVEPSAAGDLTAVSCVKAQPMDTEACGCMEMDWFAGLNSPLAV